ncbi:tRNA (adenosine(37)-N6)-dimethylallyltransferase MiaA [Acidicapsa ligni]|uniref:tRNA (adenosine(37)-N6)-dimethylallyltransferase MiaA n=1 Tax=Acidicapsa ligni TaxID=542300 RepID=UPI0021E0CB7A|nr:tRNA (adenosine(37)-N6)-dimethylallyltransferase MiaA [Acidicapsa ligni]
MALSRRLVAFVVAPRDPLAVLILGPTGSGKTALALSLGKHFNGEIISCDSVAVYHGMDIGSAKPTLDERRQLPHHLIDVANPDQPFTAGDYSRQARAALHEIAARGHLPIVTGGTGLYLRAMTLGLFNGPARRDDLRARLTSSHQRHGANWLHRILTRVDPISASRIHANDIPKLIRAIEVCLAAKQPISAAFTAGEHPGRDPLTGFRLLRIGLNPPRQSLYERLNRRAAQMFQDGLVEETRQLLHQYGSVKALDSLGYRQALSVINKTATFSEATAAAQQGHRNYAKRQLTWFRREPEVHWTEDFGNTEAGIQSAIALIASNR